MKHSIIIPHAFRDRNLAHCIRSLDYASENALPGIEVIVVGTTSKAPPVMYNADLKLVDEDAFRNDVVEGTSNPPPFWKTRLLNRGIDLASGKTLTFLDADAIVGPRFMEGPEVLAGSNLTYLAYRVRYLPEEDGKKSWNVLRMQFAKYGDYPRAHEGYGEPEHGEAAPRWPVYGNSQFSITRENLGGLRFDMNYFGRSMEDLDMLRRIGIAHEGNFHTAIMRDGLHAIFHFRHPHSAGYGADQWSDRNWRRYFGRRKYWIVCKPGRDEQRAFMLMSELHLDNFAVVEPGGPWIQEVLPIDQIIELDEDGRLTMGECRSILRDGGKLIGGPPQS